MFVCQLGQPCAVHLDADILTANLPPFPNGLVGNGHPVVRNVINRATDNETAYLTLDDFVRKENFGEFIVERKLSVKVCDVRSELGADLVYALEQSTANMAPPNGTNMTDEVGVAPYLRKTGVQ